MINNIRPTGSYLRIRFNLRRPERIAVQYWTILARIIAPRADMPCRSQSEVISEFLFFNARAVQAQSSIRLGDIVPARRLFLDIVQYWTAIYFKPANN